MAALTVLSHSNVTVSSCGVERHLKGFTRDEKP